MKNEGLFAHMPFKIIRPDHFELLGKGLVLLTAPHAAGPEADLHTGQIVEDAALVSRSYAVVGKVSREYVDLNRIQAARTEFRRTIDVVLEENSIKCILDIHGKREPGVDVGTGDGETASQSTADLVKSRLSKDFMVRLNDKYRGLKTGSIVTTYPKKDAQGQFALEAVQIEFGHEERHAHRDKVITDIAELVALINGKLGFSETD